MARRTAFQQIGQPHQQPAFTQPDGVIDGYEIKEFDAQLRHGRPGPQLTVRF
jgi:hypothetical protein